MAVHEITLPINACRAHHGTPPLGLQLFKYNDHMIHIGNIFSIDQMVQTNLKMFQWSIAGYSKYGIGFGEN